jgi:hypothetical protein
VVDHLALSLSQRIIRKIRVRRFGEVDEIGGSVLFSQATLLAT